MDFLDGGPFGLFPFFLLALSLEFESSFSRAVDVELSFSILDFLELLLESVDALVLLDDLLSVSDSELLSGENMLFFFDTPSSEVDFEDALLVTVDEDLGVFDPELRSAVFPLAKTVAAVFGLAEQRLRGGNGLGLTTFGLSSSLEDDTLTFDSRLGFSSSFGWASTSTFIGDLGTGDLGAVIVGMSEVEESESELLEAEAELVDELALLLESVVVLELLSELLLLTSRFVMLILY